MKTEVQFDKETEQELLPVIIDRILSNIIALKSQLIVKALGQKPGYHEF